MKERKWKVWSLDTDATEDDARTVEAFDAGDAAELWAQWEDSRGDYAIVGGTDETVCVRADDGELSRFVVSGRTEAVYTARAAREEGSAP